MGNPYPRLSVSHAGSQRLGDDALLGFAPLGTGRTTSVHGTSEAELFGAAAEVGLNDVEPSGHETELGGLMDEGDLNSITGLDSFGTPFDPYRHYEVMA